MITHPLSRWPARAHSHIRLEVGSVPRAGLGPATRGSSDLARGRCRAGPRWYGRHVIRAHLAAELLVDGERMPVFVWTIDHPAGLVLVDTGMIDSRPEVDDLSPRPHPENIPRDVACVINTHLHFDHCGGNRLFPGVPIYVQRIERETARKPGYTIPEWVEFEGARYVELDGEAEVAAGVSVFPTPGHTPGHQP